MAIILITTNNKEFIANELQKQLGMKRYESVFRMMHKLRAIMDSRYDHYRLEDIVEYGEACVGKSLREIFRIKKVNLISHGFIFLSVT